MKYNSLSYLNYNSCMRERKRKQEKQRERERESNTKVHNIKDSNIFNLLFL